MKNQRFSGPYILIFLIALTLSALARSEPLSILTAQAANLEETVAACEANIETINGRLKMQYPSEQNPDGTWPASYSGPGTYWSSSDYKDWLMLLDRARTCLKHARRQLADLKKKINAALGASVIDTAKAKARGALPRVPLLDLKEIALAQQALINQLDEQRKNQAAFVEAIQRKGKSGK